MSFSLKRHRLALVSFFQNLCVVWRRVALWLMPFWLLFFFAIRAWKNEDAFGRYSNCVGCFWMPTVAHDLWIAALIFLLLALGYAFSDRWLFLRFFKFLFRLSGILIFTIIALDYVVGDIFRHRFLFVDFFRFSEDPKASLSVALAWLSPPYGKYKAVAVVLFVAFIITICFSGKQQKKTATTLAALAAICFSASFIMGKFPVRYIHENVVRNVFEANRPASRAKTISEPLRYEAVKRVNSIDKTCQENNTSRGMNVIVLLVESWSSWQSRLFGGSEDWTPRLDKIAQENHYFTNFYANSYMTAGGEISVVSGASPLPVENKFYAGFSDFEEERFDIPGIAKQANYESAFITTSDLSFLSLGNWLNNIRFETVEGSCHPFYEGMKRWQFDAPEDSALYARFLQWLDTRKNERPFIAVMLTVSSHPPFINPENGENDFAGTFRYADAQAAYFYEELKSRGFFENGILLITSDHRTMTPLRPGEYEKYKDRAFARVPMIVAGNVDMPKVVTDAFQQTDIAPSVAELLGLEMCRTPFIGSFLKENPQPPKYVVHMRGDDRDRVDVYYGENEVAGFRLDGDASHWMDKPPPDADLVAAWIATQRMRPRPIAY